MKKTVFLCVGGDARQIYMSKALAKNSKVYTYKIANSGENTICLKSLDLLCEKVDVLVLPMMMSQGLEVSCQGDAKLYCNELVPYLRKNAIVTGGRLSTQVIEYFSALGFDITDYFKREELVIKNCIPTAEGALQLAMQELATTIFGSRVLVIGFGRVSNATAKIFSAAGAQVSCTARKLSQLAQAEIAGYNTFHMDNLSEHICEYDLIINSVPSMIIDEEKLKCISKNALIIDLASKPGGVDFEAAARLNKRTIQALSLPGKVAPITSGEYIAQVVENILIERGV